ncbi:p24 complex component [Blastocladiella emersonii ATCC 22665]|nr:p24 complex component [Blastocladiella emersonii ATCC 22665]
MLSTWISRVAVALCALLAVAAAMTVRVPPYDQQCFFEDLVHGQIVSVSFQVGDGGNLDIDFWVSDPDHAIMHIVNRESTGTYTFTVAKDGRYSYCFSNQMSSHHEKVVQFSVTGADVPPVDPKAIVDPVMDVVNELSRDIHAIKEEQQYLVVRERQHRSTAEDINTRVMWWSLFQTAMLVAVCLFQVYYLKHFFEVKRVV